jgi:ribosomal protein L37AE/L43A
MAETKKKIATTAWMCLICGWIYYGELGSAAPPLRRAFSDQLDR